ncbi:MAG: putative addiction module antidote protein [Rhizobium sp.]|nr:putative addiction module antidote protein [Rhizobium sp.]
MSFIASATTQWDTVVKGQIQTQRQDCLLAFACSLTGVEIRRALNTVARSLGMTAVAEEAGLGRESLYKALGDNGNPEFATVLKLMRAMGLKLSALPIDEG